MKIFPSTNLSLTPPLSLSTPQKTKKKTQFRATITARHGQIQQADLSGFDASPLQGRHIHTITDWREVLTPTPTTSEGGGRGRGRGFGSCDGSSTSVVESVGTWFNQLFGGKTNDDER